MEFSAESFKIKKGEGVVLLQDKNYIWHLAKYQDGKYIIIRDGIKALSCKYVVINYGGTKVIDLKTKKVVYTGEISRLINDYIVTKSGYLIDLTNIGRSEVFLFLDTVKVISVHGDYVTLRDKEENLHIFDTKTKKFVECDLALTERGMNPHIKTIIMGSNINYGARINDSAILINASGEEIILNLRKVSEGTLITKASYYMQEKIVKTFERYVLTGQGTLISIDDFRKIPVENEVSKVFGDYLVEKLPNGKFQIIDLKTGKKALNKKFRESDIVDIKGNYANINQGFKPLVNSGNDTLYDLKTGQKCTFKGANIELLDENYLCKKTGVNANSPKTKYDIYHIPTGRLVRSEENCRYIRINDGFITFAHMDGRTTIYQISCDCSFDIGADFCCLGLDEDAVRIIYYDGTSDFYAPATLDEYDTKITGEYRSFVDIGMLAKEDTYNTTIIFSDMIGTISGKTLEEHDKKLKEFMNLLPQDLAKVRIEKLAEEEATLKEFLKEQEKKLIDFRKALEEPVVSNDLLSNMDDEEKLRRTKPE